MTPPNVQYTSLSQQVASSADGVVLLAPVDQRSQASQGPVQPSNVGQIIIFASNIGTTANVANNVTTQTVTAISTANSTSLGANLVTTDFVMAVSKPSANTNIGIAGIACNATDKIQICWCDSNAANGNYTASETYYSAVARNMNTIAVGLAGTPAVTAQTTNEVLYTLTGVGAQAVAYINANMQVSGANVTTQGSNYYIPPTVVITAANGSAGFGATGEATIGGGNVTGINITNPGSGYTAAPLISFIGGSGIAPGMIAQVNITTANTANLAIGNVRVANNGQIAVMFMNATTGNVAANANANLTFGAFKAIPMISPILGFGANCATFIASGANLSNNTLMPANGVLASDVFLNWNLTAFGGANGIPSGGNCVASGINLNVAGIGASMTAVAQVATGAIMRTSGGPLMNLYSVYIAPSACPSQTTTEQVFTLPNNMPVQTYQPIWCNKPSYTSGIGIGNVRANTANSVAIQFINNSNVSITPPAEMYLLGAFQMPTIPLLGANANAGVSSTYAFASAATNRVLDLTNELQASLVNTGVIKGS